MASQLILLIVKERLREVVKKKGYLTVRLTVRVDPPPYGQLICVFSEGYILLLFMIIHDNKQIFAKKCFLTLSLTFWPSEDEHCK